MNPDQPQRDEREDTLDVESGATLQYAPSANTATSAMMIPVMEVVLEELGEIERRSRGGGGGGGDHEDNKYKLRKLLQ